MVEDERTGIAKTIETIEKFTSARPRGWLGPGLAENWEKIGLLAEAGLEYVADRVMDDQPIEIETRAGPIIRLPYSVEINDIPMMIQHH